MSSVYDQYNQNFIYLDSRISQLERTMYDYIKLQNNVNDDYEGQLQYLNTRLGKTESELSALKKTVANLGTIGTGEVSYQEVYEAFQKAQRADIFLTGAVLDIARYTQTPIEPIVEKALGEIGGTGLTTGTLQEYVDTPQLTAAPYTQPDNPLLGFVGNFLGGAAIGGIGTLLIIGLGLYLLQNRSKK